MPISAAIRLQGETALAHRIPSALTPAPKFIRPVVETGIEPLDELFHGGLKCTLFCGGLERPQPSSQRTIANGCASVKLANCWSLKIVRREDFLDGWLRRSGLVSQNLSQNNGPFTKRLSQPIRGGTSNQEGAVTTVAETLQSGNIYSSSSGLALEFPFSRFSVSSRKRSSKGLKASAPCQNGTCPRPGNR
jgi:hypothetical protein